MSSNLEGDLNQDGIIDEMDRVRGDLGGGINQLGVQMRNMFDWQAYVRSAPLASVAAAAVLGYLLVPNSRPSVAPAANPEYPTSQPRTSTNGGLTRMLTNIVWAGVAQAGSIYIADLLTRQFMASTAGRPTPPERPPQSEETSYDLGD